MLRWKGRRGRARKHIDVLAYGAVVAIAISILTKMLNVYQFLKVEFVVTSFHPVYPVLYLVGASIWIIIAFRTRAHWLFKVSGFVGYVYGVILLAAILNTYGISQWWLLFAVLLFMCVLHIIIKRKIKL